jgi:protein-L-isoaspartate(D-aspartate) O-methyltransferase
MTVPRWRLPAVPRASGVGLTSGRAQSAMVDALRSAGVRDERVLSVMLSVPRHHFIASRAYEDVALPIGHEQTISKPSTVAKMMEHGLQHQIKPVKQMKVLEVGTGCGYQAAVLAALFGEVVSIERIRSLHELARENLRTMRLQNLRLVFGDGLLGVPQEAPYDIILVAAAGLEIPDELLLQLCLGGRLVAPVAEVDGAQAMHVVERVALSDWRLTRLDAARFVPLKSGTR